MHLAAHQIGPFFYAHHHRGIYVPGEDGQVGHAQGTSARGTSCFYGVRFDAAKAGVIAEQGAQVSLMADDGG
ncbi:hypothetical protein SDC9_103063 [bioreactor metagenome]|uniref:Uncharacterized protein n=1 Tax=bioreactor metagenome TaxID=1076179 RepID=A0A645AVD0_9ZZZZ